MGIRFEHADTIRTTPELAFAAIDDLLLTAKWVPPCVSLEKVGPGPNAPGDKLRYVYTQGGRQGEMAGEIRARPENGCIASTPIRPSTFRWTCTSRERWMAR